MMIPDGIAGIRVHALAYVLLHLHDCQGNDTLSVNSNSFALLHYTDLLILIRTGFTEVR